MRVFHILLFSVAVIALPVTVQAESESPFKGGMNYTTIGNSSGIKAKPKSESQPGHIKQKTIDVPVIKGQEEEKETAASKIWNKYKALAAGEAVEPEKQAEDAENSTLPEKESAEETENAEAQPSEQKTTGMAALIERYEQNKKRQSQMQTIQVPQPTLPKKPQVKTPE